MKQVLGGKKREVEADSGPRQGDGEMGLAHAGRSKQQQVVGATRLSMSNKNVSLVAT